MSQLSHLFLQVGAMSTEYQWLSHPMLENMVILHIRGPLTYFTVADETLIIQPVSHCVVLI